MASDADPLAPTLRIIDADEVETMTSLCVEQVSKLEHRGEFPRRVALSARRIGWIAHEVQAWIAARMKARDDAAAEEAARFARMPPAVRHRLRQARGLIEADAPT